MASSGTYGNQKTLEFKDTLECNVFTELSCHQLHLEVHRPLQQTYLRFGGPLMFFFSVFFFGFFFFFPFLIFLNSIAKVQPFSTRPLSRLLPLR